MILFKNIFNKFLIVRYKLYFKFILTIQNKFTDIISLNLIKLEYQQTI